MRSLILKRKAGFLLVETLLAIVILSVSLTLIIQSLGQSARASSYSADYVPAVIILESKLTDLWSQDIDSNDRARFPKLFDKYSYQLSNVEVSTENQGKISQADLSVEWPVGPARKKINIQTYLLLPDDEKK